MPMNFKRAAKWALIGVAGGAAASAMWTGQAAGRDSGERERIAARLQSLAPNVKVDSITRIDAGGWYEVVTAGHIFYIDPSARYVMEGSLIDIERRINLTEQRTQDASKIAFGDLPVADAIVSVKGKGQRKVAIFSDPDCPYCRRLERELAKLDNVTIYTYLFPLASIHPNALGRAESVWCAANREQAWNTAMQGGALAPAHCANPIERNLALGTKLGVNGTPTLFFADGRRIPGVMPAEQIDKLLR